MFRFWILITLLGRALCLEAQKHDYVWQSGINYTISADSTVFAIDFKNILNNGYFFCYVSGSFI